jgi:multidrug efflux system membrane fusion protein
MKRTRPRLRVAAPCALALMPLLLAACKPAEKPAEPPRAVNVVRIEGGNGTLSASYTGDVRPRYETGLAFRVPGKVTERLVEVGDTVKPGQVLARLDPGDQQLGIEAARQAVAAAEASHAQARSDFQRFGDLYKQGFISAAEFDRRKAAFDVAAAQLSQARAQLSVNRNQADYTTLRAPSESVVTTVAAEVGQVVGAGQTVLRVARPGFSEIAISVPENRLKEVKRGMDVRINLWAVPEHLYRGRVREISPAADAVTRTYLAKVTVLDADDTMQMGMTANVFLDVAADPNVVRLPSTALYQKGADTAVWVVDAGSSQVKLRPVTVGKFADDHVVVTGGLKPGETVVRAGVQKLFPDEKVRILAPRAP